MSTGSGTIGAVGHRWVRAGRQVVATVVLVQLALAAFGAVSDLSFRVIDMQVTQAEPGWSQLRFEIAVTNEHLPIVEVNSGCDTLGSLLVTWEGYTYSGQTLATDWRWIPMGYTFVVQGSVKVPIAAVSDFRIQLAPQRGEPINIEYTGAQQLAPLALPTERHDQLQLGDTITLDGEYEITPVRFEMGPPPLPYTLRLVCNVKNLTGYDSSGSYDCQIIRETRSWEAELDLWRAPVPPFMEGEVSMEVESFLALVDDVSEEPREVTPEYHLLIRSSESERFALFSLKPKITVEPSVAWRTALPSAQEITAFAESEGQVYVGDSAGRLYAVQSDNGDVLWEMDFPYGVSSLALAGQALWCWTSAETEPWNWGLYKIAGAPPRVVIQWTGTATFSAEVEFAGVDDAGFYLRVLGLTEEIPGREVPSYYANSRIKMYDAATFHIVETMHLREKVSPQGAALGERAVVRDGVAYLVNDDPGFGTSVRAVTWPSGVEIWDEYFDTIWRWTPRFLEVIDGCLLTEMRGAGDWGKHELLSIDISSGEIRWRVEAPPPFRYAVSSKRLFLRAAFDYDYGVGPCVPFEAGAGFVGYIPNCSWEEAAAVLREAVPVGATDSLLFSQSDQGLEALRITPIAVGVSPVARRRAPEAPHSLAQEHIDGTEIPWGDVVDDARVVLCGTAVDADGDNVQLQVRLSPTSVPLDSSDATTAESAFQPSGTLAACEIADLSPGEYHWEARTVDDSGLASAWTQFARNLVGEADFVVPPRSSHPVACRIYVTEAEGIVPVSETEVGRRLYVRLEGSSSGVSAVRLSSDETQDRLATGKWTKWQDWDTSSDDWDSATKSWVWAFATGGAKEIWAETTDKTGAISSAVVNILVHPGYAIIVAGQGGWRDKRGIDHCANNAYRALRNLGFDDEHVFYLNSNFPQDVDGDGADEVDGPALLDSFVDAVAEVKDGTAGNPVPVVLYFSGHGAPDCFMFDESSPDQGYLWVSNPTAIPGLKELLGRFASATPILAIVGSCYSGCFIASTASSPESVSSENRIIITANHHDTKRILWGWARSSDCMWGDLSGGSNVADAFAGRMLPVDQTHLWLDDNGDAEGHPPQALHDDGQLAAITRIGVPGSEDLRLTSWILYWLQSPGELQVHDGQGRITGVVNGDVREEIPESLYDAEANAVIMFALPEACYCEVTGTEDGTYGLEASLIAAGRAMTATARDVPTTRGEVHRYTIDWSRETPTDSRMLLQVDADGDGEFETTVAKGLSILGSDLETSLQPGGRPAQDDKEVGATAVALAAFGGAAVLMAFIVWRVRLHRNASR